ncbi:MAG: thiol peroxidase [Candidatus Brocadiia bacterium]
MKERHGAVTFKGSPLTLVGNELHVGDKAPEFTVAANDLAPFALSKAAPKWRIISSVPSLDTPVCDIETRRFNAEAGKLAGKVEVLTVSMDLPFAQKRWCGAADAKNVVTLSDYRDASFGNAFGLLIKELHLLARSVMIVDEHNIVRYVQLVKETTHEPDYDDVIANLHKLMGR